MCIHSCSKCISQLSYRNKIFGQILRHWTEEQNAKHIHPSERNQILLQRDIVLQVLHFNWVLESWLCDRTNYDQIPLCWMLYPTNLAHAHWSWWISASVGAGTTWNAGVRRSTRIKSRPLEYWCGERFIYGRVHDSKWSSKCCHFCLKLHNILLCMLKLSLTFSVCHITWKRNQTQALEHEFGHIAGLATVIGVKYASPSDSKLKVKSFVAEEYADLVAKAALY